MAMNKLKIITFPDPILISPSESVEEIDAGICDILDAMTSLMMKKNGVGLAAPQIGILKRLITVHFNGEGYQVINPQITWQNGSAREVEGCLSLPNQYFEVERAEEVVVESLSPEKNKFTLLAKGLLARIFQHEIDHLNGILINSIGHFILPSKAKLVEI